MSTILLDLLAVLVVTECATSARLGRRAPPSPASAAVGAAATVAAAFAESVAFNRAREASSLIMCTRALCRSAARIALPAAITAIADGALSASLVRVAPCERKETSAAANRGAKRLQFMNGRSACISMST